MTAIDRENLRRVAEAALTGDKWEHERGAIGNARIYPIP